jgi:hypothetical protein
MAQVVPVQMDYLAVLAAAVQEPGLLDRAIPQVQAPPKATTAVGQSMQPQITALAEAVALQQ